MEEHTITIVDNSPTFQIFQSDNDEILRFENNGDIFLKGKLIKNDIEVVDGFHEFLQSQGFNFQDSMIGKVQQLVKSEPNDMELGKKIRNLLK